MKGDSETAGFKLQLVSPLQPRVDEPGDPNRGEIEDYIGDMLQELRELAQASGLRSLAGVLEYAAHEAGKLPRAG